MPRTIVDVDLTNPQFSGFLMKQSEDLSGFSEWRRYVVEDMEKAIFYSEG